MDISSNNNLPSVLFEMLFFCSQRRYPIRYLSRNMLTWLAEMLVGFN